MRYVGSVLCLALSISLAGCVDLDPKPDDEPQDLPDDEGDEEPEGQPDDVAGLPVQLPNPTALALQSQSGSVCTYETPAEAVIDTGNGTVAQTYVRGSGEMPTTVTVSRTGSTADVTAVLNNSATAPTGVWERRGQGLACNTPLGCGTGQYTVVLEYGQGTSPPEGGCQGEIVIELQIP